jgi:hypothetical protein
MEGRQHLVKDLIVWPLLLLIAGFLLGLWSGFVIIADALRSKSMTVDHIVKGDLLTCPKQRPGEYGVVEFAM